MKRLSITCLLAAAFLVVGATSAYAYVAAPHVEADESLAIISQ